MGILSSSIQKCCRNTPTDDFEVDYQSGINKKESIKESKSQPIIADSTNIEERKSKSEFNLNNLNNNKEDDLYEEDKVIKEVNPEVNNHKINDIQRDIKGHNKIPLEIINELQPDLSSKNSPKLINSHKQDNQEIIQNEQQKDILIQENSNKISPEKPLDNEISHIENFDVSPVLECSKILNFEKSNKLNKSVMSNNPYTQWKKIKIDQIFSNFNLEKLTNDDLIYKGELFKLTQDPKVKTKITGSYALKYVTLSRLWLSYYKSKESFLRLENYSKRIESNTILTIDRIENYKNNELNLNKSYFHFYIKTGNKNKDFSNDLSRSNYDQQQISIIDQVSGYQKNKEKDVKKLKKINLIEKEKGKDGQKFFEQMNIEEENKIEIHVFASKDENLINQWIYLLNYVFKMKN